MTLIRSNRNYNFNQHKLSISREAFRSSPCIVKLSHTDLGGVASTPRSSGTGNTTQTCDTFVSHNLHNAWSKPQHTLISYAYTTYTMQEQLTEHLSVMNEEQPTLHEIGNPPFHLNQHLSFLGKTKMWNFYFTFWLFTDKHI